MIGNRQNVIFILTDDQGWEELGCLQHAGHQTAHFGKWHLGQSRGGGTSVPDVGEYGFATGACNGTEGPELCRSDRGEEESLHNSTEVIISRSIEFLESRDSLRLAYSTKPGHQTASG